MEFKIRKDQLIALELPYKDYKSSNNGLYTLLPGHVLSTLTHSDNTLVVEEIKPKLFYTHTAGQIINCPKSCEYVEHIVSLTKSGRKGGQSKNSIVVPIEKEFIRNIEISSANILHTLDISHLQDFDRELWIDSNKTFIDHVLYNMSMFRNVDNVSDEKAISILPENLYTTARNQLTNKFATNPFMLTFKGYIKILIIKVDDDIIITQHAKPEVKPTVDYTDLDVENLDDLNEASDESTINSKISEISNKSDMEDNKEYVIHAHASGYNLLDMLIALMSNIRMKGMNILERYNVKNGPELFDAALLSLKDMYFSIKIFITPYLLAVNAVDEFPYTILKFHLNDNEIPSFVMPLIVIANVTTNINETDHKYYVISNIDMTSRLSKFAISKAEYLSLNICDLRETISIKLHIYRGESLNTINPDRQANRTDIFAMYNKLKNKTHALNKLTNMDDCSKMELKFMNKSTDVKVNSEILTKPKLKDYANSISSLDYDPTYISCEIDGEPIADKYSIDVNLAVSINTRSSSSSYRGSKIYENIINVDINKAIISLFKDELYISDMTDNVDIIKFVNNSPCIAYDFETHTYEAGNNVFVYNFSIAYIVPFTISEHVKPRLTNEIILNKWMKDTSISYLIKNLDIETGFMGGEDGIPLTYYVNGITFNKDLILDQAPMQLFLHVLSYLVLLAPSNICIAHNGMRFDNLFIKAYGDQFRKDVIMFNVDMKSSIIGQRKIQLIGTVVTSKNKVKVKFADSCQIVSKCSLKELTNIYAPPTFRKGEICSKILNSSDIAIKVKNKSKIIKYAIQDSVALIVSMYNYYIQSANVITDVRTYINDKAGELQGRDVLNPNALISSSSITKQLVQTIRSGVYDTPNVVYRYFRNVMFHGGYCLALPDTQLGVVYPCVNALDLTSAYPSIMSKPLPEKLIDIITNPTEQDLKDKMGFIHLRIDKTLTHMTDYRGNIKPICPMLRSHIDGLLIFSHADPDKPTINKEFKNEHVISTNVYKYMLSIGYLVDVTLFALWVYEPGTSCKPMIDGLYKKKLDADIAIDKLLAEGVEESDDRIIKVRSMRANAKLTINKCYGYFGINKETTNNTGDYTFLNNNRTGTSVAAWCTAEASLRLFKMINALTYLGCKVLYCDTDSVYFQTSDYSLYRTAQDWVDNLYPKDIFDMLKTGISKETRENPYVNNLINDIRKYAMHEFIIPVDKDTKATPKGRHKSSSKNSKKDKAKHMALSYANRTGLGDWCIDADSTQFCVWWVKQYAYNKYDKKKNKIILKKTSAGFRFKDKQGNDTVDTMAKYSDIKFMSDVKEELTLFVRPYIDKGGDLRDKLHSIFEAEEWNIGDDEDATDPYRITYAPSDRDEVGLVYADIAKNLYNISTSALSDSPEDVEANRKADELKTIAEDAVKDLVWIKPSNLPAGGATKIQKQLKQVEVLLDKRNIKMKKLTKHFNIHKMWTSSKLVHVDGLVGHHNT